MLWEFLGITPCHNGVVAKLIQYHVIYLAGNHFLGKLSRQLYSDSTTNICFIFLFKIITFSCTASPLSMPAARICFMHCLAFALILYSPALYVS